MMSGRTQVDCTTMITKKIGEGKEAENRGVFAAGSNICSRRMTGASSAASDHQGPFQFQKELLRLDAAGIADE